MRIRKEEKRDNKEVEFLTREAFWNKYRPGCDEHLILHKLRSREAFIKELSLVLECDNRIIGHIAYSKSKVIGEHEHNVLTFGPVSIHPFYQKKGLGEKLIKHSFDIAKHLGFDSIIIFGDPKYYNRFGFESSQKYKITMKDGNYTDYLMVLQLKPNSLKGVEGKFYEDIVFDVNEQELLDFEKQYQFRSNS